MGSGHTSRCPTTPGFRPIAFLVRDPLEDLSPTKFLLAQDMLRCNANGRAMLKTVKGGTNACKRKQLRSWWLSAYAEIQSAEGHSLSNILPTCLTTQRYLACFLRGFSNEACALSWFTSFMVPFGEIKSFLLIYSGDTLPEALGEKKKKKETTLLPRMYNTAWAEQCFFCALLAG